MTRRLLRTYVVLICCLALPAAARAQSTISGIVRDTSGAVLPGVTVEAVSEALIERTRSATTDNSGAFRITDLRPGRYTVTFTLNAFQTVKRENLELPSEFTLTLNTEMSVGQISEVLTISAVAPTVDIENAVQISRLDRDVLDNIPAGQNIWEIGQLILGVQLSSPTVGGQGGATQTYMSVHGMSAAQNVVLVDGMTVSGLELNGTVQGYFNNDMSQEITYQTSGIGADRSGGGITINMIPREGGNRFSGDFKISHRPGDWIGDNFTDRLKDMGANFVNSVEYFNDFTISQGGPIKRDKLWFFGSFHEFDTGDLVADTYFDDGSQGTDKQRISQGLGRITYQINSKTKVSGYYDKVNKTRSHDMSANVDPETASSRWTSPNYATGAVKVSSTLSSRMLWEAGYSANREYRDVFAQEGILKERGSAEWIASASRTTNDTGGARTTAPSLPGQDWPARDNLQGSLSWVTGSHHAKFGIQYQWGRFFHSNTANADLTQRYDTFTRVGNEYTFQSIIDVVVRNTPIASVDRLNRDMGIYAMDSWKTKRLTLNYGLRYEHINAQNDEYSVPAGRFVPARTIPAVKDVPNWHDIAPRFSGVYDVFGTGKTAIKYSLNRYNRAGGTALAATFNTLTSATRSLAWTDLNNNDIAEVPDVYDANGNPTYCVYQSTGCEINLSTLRAANGTLFGLPGDASTYEPYERAWNLEQIVEVQHELMPRFSLTGSWTRGSDKDIARTINRFRQPNDYTPVTMFNPIDGTPITVYSIKDTATRDRLAQGGANLTYTDTDAKNIYHQYALEFRARPYNGATIFGGYTASIERATNCESSRPELVVNPNDLRFCDSYDLPDELQFPYAQDFRIGATLPLKYGVQLGLTYLNNDEGPYRPTYAIIPGTGVTATRYPDGSPASTRKVASKPAPACPTQDGCVPNGLVLPNFTLPTGTTSLTVNLYPISTLRSERLNQLDLKLSKTWRFDRISVAPTLDIFNVFNEDTIIDYQSLTYATTAGTYLVPEDVLLGRVISLGALVRW